MHLYIKLAFCLALQTDKLSIVNCQYVYEKIQGGYQTPTLNREAGYELPAIYWDVFVPRFFVHSMIQIKPISFFPERSRNEDSTILVTLSGINEIFPYSVCPLSP